MPDLNGIFGLCRSQELASDQQAIEEGMEVEVIREALDGIFGVVLVLRPHLLKNEVVRVTAAALEIELLDGGFKLLSQYS